jgi:hypothetical protein
MADANSGHSTAKFGEPAEYVTGVKLVKQVFDNVAQDIIYTSTDKLYRPLQEWRDQLRQRHSWIEPVALFVTLLFAQVTTDAKDKFGIKKEMWGGIFLLVTIAAGCWMTYKLLQLTKPCLTIDDVIKRITGVVSILGPAEPSDLPAGGPKTAKILEVPRVPFRAGQNADFVKVEASDLRGFNLKITVPLETYWRCGFILAPEDYVRDGRVDVTIAQYFLFHVSRGDAKNPKELTGLYFQVYQQERSVQHSLFHSGSPVEVKVAFPARDGHVDIAVGDKRCAVDLDPNYLRYLYVLAWADMFPPFRVPIEITRL